MVAETDGWCFCIYGIIFNVDSIDFIGVFDSDEEDE